MDEPKSTAVGHDDRRASAGPQQAQKQREKEQFGLLGLDDPQEVLRATLVVERTGEGRVGEDERVAFLLARVVLREAVAVDDVGVFHAVQEHVHAADAQHGVVEVEPVEKAVVEVFARLRVAQDLRVAATEVFARGHEEAARAAGGIADDVARGGGGQLDDELDDVARGAELAVLPGAGDLAEHVLVEVAIGVAVLHGHGVDHVHDLGEQRGRGDGEARVLHVVRVGRAVAAKRAQEGKDVVVDDREHFLGLEMLEARPAQVVVRPAPGIAALGEDAALHRALEAQGFIFLQGVEVVEALEEEQVGDLLDDFEGIGDATGPEGVPEGIDLGAEFAGEDGREGAGQAQRGSPGAVILSRRRGLSCVSMRRRAKAKGVNFQCRHGFTASIFRDAADRIAVMMDERTKNLSSGVQAGSGEVLGYTWFHSSKPLAGHRLAALLGAEQLELHGRPVVQECSDGVRRCRRKAAFASWALAASADSALSRSATLPSGNLWPNSEPNRRTAMLPAIPNSMSYPRVASPKKEEWG